MEVTPSTNFLVVVLRSKAVLANCLPKEEGGGAELHPVNVPHYTFGLPICLIQEAIG